MSDALLLLVWFAAGVLVAAMCLLDRLALIERRAEFLANDLRLAEKKISALMRDNEWLGEQGESLLEHTPQRLVTKKCEKK